MLDGAALRRLPGGVCVLSRRNAFHVLEGVSFSGLKRALAAWLRSGSVGMRQVLGTLGYAPDEAEPLVELLGALGEAPREELPRGGERLLSAGEIEGWIGRRAGAVSARLRPVADAAEGPLLLVGHTGWWVGPRGGACAECGRLAFAEAWWVAGETGEALGGATHQAIVLSRATLERMAEAVATRGEKTGGGVGWVQGTFGGAPFTDGPIRHPACGVCAGARPSLGMRPRLSSSSVPLSTEAAADAAARALGGLDVASTETVEQADGTWRGLPLVTVAWRRACRDAAGDITLQEGTQVGAGGTLAQRLLTARAEAVERFLVATRGPDVRGRTRAAMGDRAVDPGEWGLFTPGQYASRGFPFRPIAPDDPLDWVRAWDLSAGRWTHVPLDLVNGGAGVHLPASSTGAAAHPSVDRVVTNGLLEILEREALQRAWYRGEPPAVLPHRWLRGEAAEQEAWLGERGWRVHLRHVRGRAERHVVCAIGIVEAGVRAGGAVFTSGADGALDRAVARALRELVTAVEGLDAWPEGGEPAEKLDAAWVHDDPAAIQRLYLDPAMGPALEFFLGGPTLAVRPDDREDTAGALVQALVGEGLRPVYVDCTAPGAAPFHAGKTILCGALPHSFATGLLRVGAGPFAPPRRVRAPPPRGYRPAPGETTPYPFPLG